MDQFKRDTREATRAIGRFWFHRRIGNVLPILISLVKGAHKPVNSPTISSFSNDARKEALQTRLVDSSADVWPRRLVELCISLRDRAPNIHQMDPGDDPVVDEFARGILPHIPTETDARRYYSHKEHRKWATAWASSSSSSAR